MSKSHQTTLSGQRGVISVNARFESFQASAFAVPRRHEGEEVNRPLKRGESQVSRLRR